MHLCLISFHDQCFQILQQNRMLKNRTIQTHTKSTDSNMFLALNCQDTISVLIEDTASNRTINITEPKITCSNLGINDEKNTSKLLKSSRKLCNSSMKKMGTTLFSLFHQKRQAENNKKDLQFSSIKSQIKQSSKKLLKSKHKVTHSELLQARSIQLDEQLKQIHTKRENEIIENNRKKTNCSQKDTQQVQIIYLNRLSSVPQFFSQKSSKDIHRKLQSENKSNKKQKEDGFYTKLKIKLKNQIQKIEAKKHQGKQNFLIEGCKLTKYDSSINISRKPLTDRPRPQSSLARTGVQYQAAQFSDRDRRPKTARSRTVQRKQIQYMSANADDIFKKKPKSRPRTTKSSLQKKGEYNFQSTMNKTLKHVSPLYQAKVRSSCKVEVKRQKLKERMLTLLVDCENQTNQFCQVNSGFKVFESFTNRMNKGLSQVSKLLENAQYVNHSYSQFIEK